MSDPRNLPPASGSGSEGPDPALPDPALSDPAADQGAPGAAASLAASSAATPPEAPLGMPSQSLAEAPACIPPRRGAAEIMRLTLARGIAFGGAAALAVYGAWEMLQVFGNEKATPLQMLLLGLFTITFGWIAMSATQALAGLLAPRPDYRKADAAPLRARTAIIMPVYHENPAETCAALEAMGREIAEAGEGAAFEIFILSDSRKPQAWLQETAAFTSLRRALDGRMQVWYRRRLQNTGRKAGNLREFVERWGARYDQMLVLDADSVMSADTVIRMARRMQAAPRLGILQTVPILAGGTTLFARIQQFAGRLYGPAIARGVSSWQGLDGNYWGHNAMIRVPAFAACCGLPELPGRAPFGGHVLSHDFVEAALIRRGGWDVRMDPDLTGSWEGSPQTLLDLAARDRRWAQGNLQHAAILGARGLSFANRAHFVIGIGSYLMSPIWLALLLTGAALTTQSLVRERSYFPDALQLFPDWPVFDAERMFGLFGLSMALLFLPKILGVLRALCDGALRRAHGGAGRITLGALTEILLSALYAPVLMLFQARQIFEILSGVDGGWNAQSREAEHMSWRDAFRSHWPQMVIGLCVAAATLHFAPVQFLWLSPVLLGLILTPALSRASGREPEGPVRALLSTPEDLSPPPIMQRRDALRLRYGGPARLDLAGLLGDARAIDAQIAGLDHGAPASPARVDLVSARAKLSEASDAAEAAAWLSEPEAVAVLGDSDLLRLARLRLARGVAPAAEEPRLRA